MSIGSGATIAADSVVHPDAEVGTNCTVGNHVVIEASARIGDRVTVGSGAFVGAGVTLEDDVFVGANVTFADERREDGAGRPASERTVVRSSATVGAGATVLPGVEVGHHATVGAGAVVTRAIPRNAIVVGNPARIAGYVGSDREALRPVRQASVASVDAPSVIESVVPGVELHVSQVARDLRGSLVAGEYERPLPFVPHRYFLVFDVPGAHVRGEHAHMVCHQYLVCVSGEVHVIVDDGNVRQEFVLDDKHAGLYMPPMIWGIQYRYSPGSVLLVLASHAYDPEDYIRDYGDFLRHMGRT